MWQRLTSSSLALGSRGVLLSSCFHFFCQSNHRKSCCLDRPNLSDFIKQHSKFNQAAQQMQLTQMPRRTLSQQLQWPNFFHHMGPTIMAAIAPEGIYNPNKIAIPSHVMRVKPRTPHSSAGDEPYDNPISEEVRTGSSVYVMDLYL